MRKTFYVGKEKPSTPLPASEIRWTYFVMAGTLGGGTLASIITLIAGEKDLALGFFGGALLSALNFHGLKILTEKVLSSGEKKGKRVFWSWNVARWILFAFFCWLFLAVSRSCLLGAVSSYLWFLLVVGWAGWRSASSSQKAAG